MGDAADDYYAAESDAAEARAAFLEEAERHCRRNGNGGCLADYYADFPPTDVIEGAAQAEARPKQTASPEDV